MIAKILHIANGNPSVSGDRERFYAMKERILKRWGTPDGYDIQHIPGKVCFGCDGSGTYYHWSGDPDRCWRCYGSGWWKSPRWVVLDRWKLGRFTFHVPGQVHHTKPESGTERKQITGYIEHIGYTWRQELWSHFALGMLFDRQLAWLAAKQITRPVWYSRPVKFFWHRCIRCKHRAFRFGHRIWTCRTCEKIDVTRTDIPF